MAIYIALLRGINVGGKNRIKMDDLKKSFVGLGFSHIETYIQSGNILFETNKDEEVIKSLIEKEINQTFGISISIVLRTGEELIRIVKDCPFTADEIVEAERINTEGESLYVALLSKTPADDYVNLLEKYKSELDQYKTLDKNIYLLLRHSIRNSKLANNLQKLDASVTVRNWKTMMKLSEMVNGH
jgi:uncharacterized protein (DUF1697 family)